MAEHLFITEGGYFYKMAPMIALPQQTDLFGQPLGGSPRNIAQLHGFFVGKWEDRTGSFILLKITGRCSICDDVLGAHESHELESMLRISCNRKVYTYPFKEGHRYLVSTDNITEL